jgi:C4-dicarboxylate-binding protein DctP
MQAFQGSRRVLLSVCAMAAAMVFSGSVAAQAPIVIKFSHVVADQTPKGQAAMKFKELAEKAAAGQGAGAGVPQQPAVRRRQGNGSPAAGRRADHRAVAVQVRPKYTKKLQVFDLPFLFDDLEAVDRFQAGEGPGPAQVDGKQGHRGPGLLHNGMKQLSANKPLRTPADAKGLKFRIQASDVLEEQFKASAPTRRSWPSPRSTRRCRPAWWTAGEHLVEHLLARSSTRCRSTSWRPTTACSTTW